MWVILRISRTTGAMTILGPFTGQGCAVRIRDRWIAQNGKLYTYRVHKMAADERPPHPVPCAHEDRETPQ